MDAGMNYLMDNPWPKAGFLVDVGQLVPVAATGFRDAYHLAVLGAFGREPEVPPARPVIYRLDPDGNPIEMFAYYRAERLDDESGGHCAMGAFFADNPNAIVRMSLIDEVAAVNDSVPPTATPYQRWRKVNSWLRFKIAALCKKAERQHV